MRHGIIDVDAVDDNEAGDLTVLAAGRETAGYMGKYEAEQPDEGPEPFRQGRKAVPTRKELHRRARRGAGWLSEPGDPARAQPGRKLGEGTQLGQKLGGDPAFCATPLIRFTSILAPPPS